MKVLRGLDGLRSLPAETALSVGNFDGVHRGHGHILETARELNRKSAGAGVAVVTFEPHPLMVIKPELAPPRLSSARVKRELLEKRGVDFLVELAPDRSVLNLRAEEFWAILRDEVRPTHLIEGSSFNFGKDRGGTIERLREWSADSSVALHVVDAVNVVLLNLSVVQVSSSLIRWLIGHGRVRDAAICLDRPYTLEGEVIHGHHRGRTIGLPTANLKLDDQMPPMEGVYAGRAAVSGTTYAAAISIGTMPTFGQHQPQIEAHLIDFDGDLYGQVIRVELLDWLREQRKFGNVESLKLRMNIDLRDTREIASI
jgi:riboflavin kinase/FMN adenylyltransferase